MKCILCGGSMLYDRGVQANEPSSNRFYCMDCSFASGKKYSKVKE